MGKRRLRWLWLLALTAVCLSCTSHEEIPATAVPLPTITPSPTPCDETVGQVQKLTFENNTYLPTEVNVYLPPCYEVRPNAHYPVLYMLHGSGLDQNIWLELGIAEEADRLINEEAIEPLIIVMPPSLSFGPKFDAFMVDELIPTIDEQFRTQTARNGRWLAGMSFGATLVIRVGLQHADLFGKLGILSVSYIGISNEDAANWLDALAPEELPEFMLDVGESDSLLQRHHGNFIQLLAERNIPHDSFIRPGGHTLPYWERNVGSYLQWFAGP
ncbi:MAG: hypothetical protein H6653_17640 [Ardenticatenaceae bacterium]|nr:hypothetical protein [Ardenticatenaceae bacterium]